MIRLNKYLADCGVASRRAADELLRAGRVRVGGQRASVGQSVDPARQRVTVDGRPVRQPAARHDYVVLNKPAGIVTTMHDERGRASVADLVKSSRRVFPVGRLDAETTGLLLFTSDGALARVLTHPRFGVEKRYRVTIDGPLPAAAADALGATAVKPLPGRRTTFVVSLREGRNRQVRRMCAAQGLRVAALARTHFGPLTLGDLPVGRTRKLTKREIEALNALDVTADDAGPST